jgi:hypothetical protein
MSPDSYDIPFDQYQRYRLSADLARASYDGRGAPDGFRLLDVGGYHQDFYGRPQRPIRDFVDWAPSVSVDLAPGRLAAYVRARGDALPFADASFDCVCSVDVLEHVPPARRAALLGELSRVAGHLMIVAAPFASPLVSRAEAILAAFIERTLGYVQTQLAEHRAHGLPSLEETLHALSGFGWTVATFPYGNLWRWLFMMLDKHALAALTGSRRVHGALDTRYNREIYPDDREPPCYRHFIVAARDPADAALAAARTRYGATAEAPRGEIVIDTQAAMFFALAELHAGNQALQAQSEPERRDRHVEEAEAHRAEMYRHLAAKDEYIEKLERLFGDVERSMVYRTVRALRRLTFRSDPHHPTDAPR